MYSVSCRGGGTYHEVSVHAEGAVESSLEPNGEVDGRKLGNGEDGVVGDNVVERAGYAALEVDDDAAVEGGDVTGLRAGEGIVEEISLEGRVGQ